MESIQKPISSWRLLLGLIDRPKEILGYVGKSPGGLWIAPATITLGTLLLLNIVSAPLVAQEAQEMVRQQLSTLPASQAEEAMSQVATFSSPLFMALMAILGGALALIVGWLIRSGTLFFIFSLVGNESGFRQIFNLTLWAWLPLAFRDLVKSTYILINGKLILHQGLAFLLATGVRSQDLHNLLYSFLSSLDIFVVWHLILIALGVKVAARLPSRQATWVTLGYWAVTTLLALIPTLLSSLLLPS